MQSVHLSDSDAAALAAHEAEIEVPAHPGSPTRHAVASAWNRQRELKSGVATHWNRAKQIATVYFAQGYALPLLRSNQQCPAWDTRRAMPEDLDFIRRPFMAEPAHPQKAPL